MRHFDLVIEIIDVFTIDMVLMVIVTMHSSTSLKILRLGGVKLIDSNFIYSHIYSVPSIIILFYHTLELCFLSFVIRLYLSKFIFIIGIGLTKTYLYERKQWQNNVNRRIGHDYKSNLISSCTNEGPIHDKGEHCAIYNTKRIYIDSHSNPTDEFHYSNRQSI